MNTSKILVTGGTGSFGRKFIDITLSKNPSAEIVVMSRDEMKQWALAERLGHNPRVKFFIGDVRDSERLSEVAFGVDTIIHAAATKIVPTAEYNPIECIKTNIDGAINVIKAAKLNKVKKVVALSTDKASNPVNLYGATKLASDKLFCAANDGYLNSGTQFCVVRYGNVMGSRGSVIPFFINRRKAGKNFPITDHRMTRFMISLEEGVELVRIAHTEMGGGEIFVKKIPSITIGNIADAIDPSIEQREIGIRPGEKLHEQMIGLEDAQYTYEYETYYKILPAIYDKYKDEELIKNGRKVPTDFVYSSDRNTEWMSTEALRAWIEKNSDVIGYL